MADHVWLPANGAPKNFRSKLKNIPPPVPLRPDRLAHARTIHGGLRAAFDAADAQVRERTTRAAEAAEPWSYVQLQAPEATFSPDRYEIKAIEVLSVRKDGESGVAATLYVPTADRPEYFQRLQKYRHENTKETGRPRYHDLFDSIDALANATARSLWTDALPFPEGVRPGWWEVWLVASRAQQVLAAAVELGMHLSEPITILDRSICVVKADTAQIERLVINGNGIAELRAGVEPRFISRTEGDPSHQDLVKELVARIRMRGGGSTYVSILDTGANPAHPLLTPVLDQAHHLAIDGLSPLGHEPHATSVGGLAIYGDLAAALSHSGPLEVTHRLESVNIDVRYSKANVDEARHFFAQKVLQGIAHAEFSDPHPKRVFCLAMTMGRSSGGTPSSWSLALDQVAVEDDAQRLVIVSAGNVLDANGVVIGSMAQSGFYTENEAFRIHDPAQAWNVLSVGGYTELTTLSAQGGHAGYTALAPLGEISPYASTSALWPRPMPIKPDIVCEAGNMAWFGPDDAVISEELEMLTPSHSGDGMRAFAQTSGATALAARLAAQIWSRYPHFQPETIRGILVHSSSWTPAMELRHGKNQHTRYRGLRVYGYGVPDAARALESGDDSATIIIESRIQPYAMRSKEIVGAEMVIHDLPWPTEILESVRAGDVELRVTLSYFIEPLPGARSFRGRYPYQSHGLRFAVQRANEKKPQFLARISKMEGDEPSETVKGKDFWAYGDSRNKGSVQSDFATEAGANIAKRSCIAIYPNGVGWWKSDEEQGRFNSSARYALIVSLRPAAGVAIPGLFAAVQAASVGLGVQSAGVEVELETDNDE